MISSTELAAYLDESLPSETMAAIEEALRKIRNCVPSLPRLLRVAMRAFIRSAISGAATGLAALHGSNWAAICWAFLTTTSQPMCRFTLK